MPLLLLGACASPATRLADAPSRVAAMGDLRIHYKDLGAGRETLVFVHGWCCDMSVWRLQTEALAPKARLILIDLPGHGQSPAKPQIPYAHEFFAEAIDAVLRHAGVEKAIFVGHSNGTVTIRQYYRAHPEKVKALVVVDGMLRPFTKDPAQFESFVEMVKDRAKVEPMLDQMLATATPELKREVKALMLSAPDYVRIDSFASTASPALWTEEAIAVPVHVILATSPFWTDEYEAFVRKLAPKVTYQVWDGVGHFLQMESPDRFNAEMIKLVE